MWDSSLSMATAALLPLPEIEMDRAASSFATRSLGTTLGPYSPAGLTVCSAEAVEVTGVPACRPAI